MAHRVFITGAAGYIGAMLCELFSQHADVERIIALDKEVMPETLRDIQKILWVRANAVDPSWRETVANERPDVVIHAAWQIRDIYGKPSLQHLWNVGGSEAVFDFAFGTPSVKRLVHFSTISAYGADAGNNVDRRFTEADGLRASDFRYAEEKRVIERQLERTFAQAQSRGGKVSVAVVRPAAVTGPRGRARRSFGLQSALTGRMKDDAVHRLVSLLVSFLPVTSTWCRQFLHEDDVADIAALLAFDPLPAGYNTFNACPPGDVVRPGDMAKAFGKRLVRVHPQLVRLAFFVMWHGTRGRIPTSRGTWKAYAYPTLVDGSLLTKTSGYRYRMGSIDALTRNEGRYAVPVHAGP